MRVAQWGGASSEIASRAVCDLTTNIGCVASPCDRRMKTKTKKVRRRVVEGIIGSLSRLDSFVGRESIPLAAVARAGHATWSNRQIIAASFASGKCSRRSSKPFGFPRIRLMACLVQFGVFDRCRFVEMRRSSNQQRSLRRRWPSGGVTGGTVGASRGETATGSETRFRGDRDRGYNGGRSKAGPPRRIRRECADRAIARKGSRWLRTFWEASCSPAVYRP